MSRSLASREGGRLRTRVLLATAITIGGLTTTSCGAAPETQPHATAARPDFNSLAEVGPSAQAVREGPVDSPERAAYKEHLRILLSSKTAALGHPVDTEAWLKAVMYGEDQWGIPSGILLAMGFNETKLAKFNGVNPIGATGPMQLMPNTYINFPDQIEDERGVRPYDPQVITDAVATSARYMNHLVEEYGTLPGALDHYGCGYNPVCSYSRATYATAQTEFPGTRIG